MTQDLTRLSPQATLPDTNKATENLNQDISHLNRVEPKKSLLFKSMHCEKKSAGIRNKTIDNIDLGDISMIAYRYLQNKKGQSNTKKEAFYYSFLTTGGLAAAPFTFGSSAIYSALTTIPMLPNIGNTGRYRKTKRGCKAILNDKLGKDVTSQIQKMKYNKQGLQELQHLLESQNINCDTLEKKASNFIVEPTFCARS